MQIHKASEIQRLVNQCCWSKLEHGSPMWDKLMEPCHRLPHNQDLVIYTGTGLDVCVCLRQRERQSHGLLTTVAAVLVPVEPHIHYCVTVLHCVHLCVMAYTGVPRGYKRAKSRDGVSSPNCSQSSQKCNKWWGKGERNPTWRKWNGF